MSATPASDTSESTSAAAEAKAALTETPIVLKFDGLAAGKGVAVCTSHEEAEQFIHDVMEKRCFGPGDLLVEHVGPPRDGGPRIRQPRRDYQFLATLPAQHEMRGTLLLDERRIDPATAGEIPRRHRDDLRDRQRGETFLQLAIRLLVHTGDPD